MLWIDNEEDENGRSECEEDENMKTDTVKPIYVESVTLVEVYGNTCL
jgi:hypothetical protein